jgi:hypothetical protein
MTSQENVEWLRYPDAYEYILGLLDEFVRHVPAASTLAGSLLARASCRLEDWLDHLVLASGEQPRSQLADLGFELEEVPADPGDAVYYHPGAIFPRIILRADSGLGPGCTVMAAIQVEDVSEFLMSHQLAAPIEGSLLGPYRRATAWQQAGRNLMVVERRGHSGFVPVQMAPDFPQRYLQAYEKWATRPRHFSDDREGMEHTLLLARSLVSALGTDSAAWAAFKAEREHWRRRNWAGQIQKARQDSLGLGWANHDHHTFRSSRATFPALIQILETFGFRARERFYAGAEAGWGAQVMEQPVCRFAVFADVDLSPDEVEGDFAHSPLPPRPELGTVGLWCALHGEAMLGAGLHHLAARLDFDAATTDLSQLGIKWMSPFSSFSYLRQAFSQGERWMVPAERPERLEAAGQIDGAQRARFASEGAIGSHLENIQRAEGFKGFNQQKISDIIARTDPRAVNSTA